MDDRWVKRLLSVALQNTLHRPKAGHLFNHSQTPTEFLKAHRGTPRARGTYATRCASSASESSTGGAESEHSSSSSSSGGKEPPRRCTCSHHHHLSRDVCECFFAERFESKRASFSGKASPVCESTHAERDLDERAGHEIHALAVPASDDRTRFGLCPTCNLSGLETNLGLETISRAQTHASRSRGSISKHTIHRVRIVSGSVP